MSFPVSLVGGIPGQFLECSFRGVPFVVTKGSGENGRKTAIHEYPFKNGVWVEDVGRKERRFQISGFMLGALGYSQRDLLSRACELPGPGLLIHPSLGAINAVCVGGLKWSEREGFFNVIDLEMEFIEQSNLFNATQVASAHAAMGTLSSATSLISSNGYINAVNPLAGGSDAIIGGASATAATWATPLVNFSKSPDLIASSQSSQSLSDFRVKLDSASNAISKSNSPTDLSAAMASIPMAISSSSFGLNDQIKMMLKLFGNYVDGSLPSNIPVTISGKRDIVQNMTACLSAFLSIGPLCELISLWQPNNSLDALNMMGKMKDIFENLVYISPNNWEKLAENIYQLRAKTINYLLNEASKLPDMIEIDAPANLPSLVLAQILYGDGSRYEEIEAENDYIHPAFMPSKLIAKSQ